MVVSVAFILFGFIKSSNGDEPAYGAYKASFFFLKTWIVYVIN